MTAAPASAVSAPRVAWVDVAKALGIALVFYGHFVGAFAELRIPAAVTHMKWVYSFHMPLFFLLVGLVYKDRELGLGSFIRRQVLTRLVPVWVFNVASMIGWLVNEAAGGQSRWFRDHDWVGLGRHCGQRLLDMLLEGRYAWNVVTWFLICLFTVELIQFGLRKGVRKNAALVASILAFTLLTVLAHRYRELLYDIYGPRVNWWHINSALLALVFYQLGILLSRLGFLTDRRPLIQRVLIAAACLAITLLTFRLNRALDTRAFPVALMIDAQYGHIGWFFLTALAGTFFIVYLSQVVSASRALVHVGQITLSLMCLNGVLESAASRPIAAAVLRRWPDLNTGLFSGISLGGTLLELLLCIPLTWLLMRYTPFLFGRWFPARAGVARGGASGTAGEAVADHPAGGSSGA